MTTWAATYISANSFSVEGDQTAFFKPTERAIIDCDGTLKYSSIDTVDLDLGDTIIVLKKSILTDPCGDVMLGGIWVGASGNLPPHTHEDDDTGGPDVYGIPGLDGTVWRFGEGVPSDSLGNDGDFYIDLEEPS